ncbi:unnamed protein product [Parascedosporium putredinis]|uniref:Methyltransferase domain-containing protein n=1 Tax=Parascedosporium putredinis TaxID=1442378 RepID=A0A9P1H113_9PEZI|nr:unnamed protein product [Parascedosporium putredinis]CAI7993349.1 unnamed protein product [Parascedosporium putredinis]
MASPSATTPAAHATGSPPAAAPGSNASSPKNIIDVVEQIEADNDADSTYASSTLTDTTSLRSSALSYNWEHGRRYHSEDSGAKYWGPNDERQQEAEDLHNEMHKQIRAGGLYYAPLDKPQHVLDVGCGTGAWAMDFADANPSAEVIGLDLSPSSPPGSRPTADSRRARTHQARRLDRASRILQRHPLRRQHHAPGSAIERWTDLWLQVGSKIGVTFQAAEESYDAITAAGFVNVEQRILKVPLGPWAKDKQYKNWGQWYLAFILQGIEGFAVRSFTEVLGWSIEEAHLFLAEMRKNLQDPSIHAYSELRIVYGQKAIEPSTSSP